MNQKGCLITSTILTVIGLGIAALVFVQVLKVTKAPPQYLSKAKLIANGRINDTDGSDSGEYSHTFYGTAIEILRSVEIRKRATDRVEALNPELQLIPISLNISRPTGASILNITATGSEPKYTVAYLNALLDEFVSYRREINLQTTDETLNNITEELLRLEKLLKIEESNLESHLNGKSPTVYDAELLALKSSLQSLHEKALNSEDDAEQAKLKKSIFKQEDRVHTIEAFTEKKNRIEGALNRVKKRYDGLLTLLQDIDINERRVNHYISIMERASPAAEIRPSFFGR